MKQKYKAIIQIPTARRYAYIQIEEEGTSEEIVKAYYDISKTYWNAQKARSGKDKE